MRKPAILLVWWLAMFSNTLQAQEVTIGKDNIYSGRLLLLGGYAHSYSQIIYKQEWIHAAGDINKISFQIGYAEGQVLNLTIYMGHTTKKAFENGIFNKDWIPLNDLIKVYEGEVNFPTTPGWLEISLQTPFTYNNNENLVIAIDRSSNDKRNLEFINSLIDSDQSMAVLGESVDIDPASPININGPSMLCPNIKLSGNLIISPYLYIYGPEKNISTTPGSTVSLDIETNQTAFDSNSDQPWLTISNDITNKKIIATTLGSSGNLSDWEEIARIKVSAEGIETDTTYLHKYRFEPLEMKSRGNYFVDYYNKGNLDIAGNGLNIRRNDGNDIFTTIDNPVFHVNSQVYFADYDNDGDLDFLFKHDSVKLFRNDGNGIFKDTKALKKQLKLDIDEYTSTPWCDYDNDGDLDLLVSGINENSEPDIYLYKNNGAESYSDERISLRAVSKGTIEWIDYNIDGYWDVMLSGTDINGSPVTNLYKNNGSGGFSLSNYQFPNLFNGRFSWGDYDADGDPDLIISGSSDENLTVAQKATNKILRNDGDDHFSDISPNFQLFYSCSSKWADLDNDGDLDIVMFGFIENYYSKSLLMFYENKGNNQFIELYRKESFDWVEQSLISLGNYDNDGDLDILLQTKDWENITITFRNNYNNINAKPVPPGKFGVKREGTKTILYWNSGSDTETPSKVLKYNIRIGSSPGSADITSPHADLTTGFIRFPELINCPDTFKILENLPLGKYYYSVQSIDNMLTGSEFSPEQTFSVIEPFSEMTLGVVPFGNAAITTADYDNDGDYDYLISGREAWWSDCQTKIFQNNGDSTFTESGINLVQLQGKAVWGDYDNDNDLDLLIAGNNDNNTSITKIYRNDGNGIFEDINFKFQINSQPAWLDFDNDGDLDIISAHEIFLNNGKDSFTSGNYNPGLSDALTIGDWDKDNDIDVLVSCPKTILYKNENGSLSQSNNEFFNINTGGNAKCFNYNNDPYPDLIITGQDSNYTKQTIIYKNTGEGNFTKILSEVRAVTLGSLLTGDYNSDGNSDIVLAGLSNEYLLKVYENDGLEQLREVYSNTTIKPFPYSYILSWTDFNNDGYLDIISNYNVLFSNNSNTVKLPPEAPKNLQTEILGFNVNFSWEKPSEDSHHSYNLRVGTTPGGTEIVSPMADVVTGKRLILEKGNAQLNNGWTIKDLKAAQTYYWSVQAVDNGFKGGAWAPEKSFTMQTVYPDFAADTACNSFSTSFTDMSVSPLGDITNWKWDFGDGGNSSIKNPEHTFKDPGEYTVTLSVKKDSLTFNRTKTILVKASPKAGFTSSSIAQNRTLVTFTNTSDTGNIAVTKWLWDFGDGLSFTGRDPQPHGYSANGLNKASLIVEAQNGCSDTAKADIYICNETLEKPEIIAQGPTVWYLLCSIETAKYYRWYLNDKIIPEAKGTFFMAHQKLGTYKVEISDKGECYIPSDEIKIPTGITGIEDRDPFEGVKIYPNPTPGMFTIEMDNNILGELVIDIYKQSGSKALNIKFEKTTEHFQTQIDLSGQGKGMYLINLSLDEFRAVRKVVVE